MTRQLVSLPQLIEDAKELGNNPAALYVDPDDVAELDEDEDQEED